MSKSVVIHVLDHDHRRRAQIARCAFDMGHHAEVYSGAEEFEASLPADGLVIALEEALQGGVRQLMGLLQREGRWLAIVATSTAPTVEKAVEAVKLGALDYVPVPIASDQLTRTIAGAAEEAIVRGSRIRRRMRARRRIDTLSPRERSVLGWMAAGLTNKEIGKSLGISPRTVEIHRNNLMNKLAARNSSDAVRMWLDAGIADDTDIGGYAQAS